MNCPGLALDVLMADQLSGKKDMEKITIFIFVSSYIICLDSIKFLGGHATSMRTSLT
jgi:hypothetical protein